MLSANNQLSAHIFNRQRVKLHRVRAAANFTAYDFLLREAGVRIAERLEDFRQAFSRTLILGGAGVIAEAIGARAGEMVLADIQLDSRLRGNEKNTIIICDEEWLPFAPRSFDLIVAAGTLHWVNDLPGALIQIRHALRPGGLFLAMLPGSQTLIELRQSLEHAEIALTGGVSPRISPFIDAQSGAALLQRAGFMMPVADNDVITVEYEHPMKLMRDLRGMGEANALYSSAKHLNARSVLMRASDEYCACFSAASGRVMASFEAVTLTGLAP